MLVRGVHLSTDAEKYFYTSKVKTNYDPGKLRPAAFVRRKRK